MSLIRQHLIDPEVCIRCNTCQETCPIDAVTHNDDNYVVDAAICDYCMDCIPPCPTGAIDNWRMVVEPYRVDDQFTWDELPEELDLDTGNVLAEALEDEVAALIGQAHAGQGGTPVAPPSAAKPAVNLYDRKQPAIATVTGNYRITDEDAESDVRHIILDFGATAFPVLEGQSIGIIPPGVDARGRPHHIRLYSVSSSRDGERPNHNNLALTVKRYVVTSDEEVHRGVGSNYMCDLNKGDRVEVTGPFGSTFLMPNDPQAHIVMICTGTGSAPFRAMTERRRRVTPDAPGRMLLFFGARSPGELPYFGPLKKVPDRLLEKELVFSRLPDMPKEYVQDRIRARSDRVAALLKDDRTHLYVCGLKGMETGVDDALGDICAEHDLNWAVARAAMRESGRYHVETY